jgi:orotate phosphoribosyltransferase
MEKLDKKIAQSLLQIKAIKLEPANYFTWASGWKSPIYCDNRKTLSYPEIRKIIRDGFAETIRTKFGNPDAIAGVATGAIAIGALVAEALELPFVYVRPKPKEHGLGNMIEGEIKSGSKVVVVEDLISTGKSSLQAVEALRNANIEVIGMVAIFTYEFDHAVQNFKKENVLLYTLSNYHILIETALETGYIKQSDVETLKQWRTNPEIWNQ